jgi:hypothetical protein
MWPDEEELMLERSAVTASVPTPIAERPRASTPVVLIFGDGVGPDVARAAQTVISAAHHHALVEHMATPQRSPQPAASTRQRPRRRELRLEYEPTRGEGLLRTLARSLATT